MRGGAHYQQKAHEWSIPANQWSAAATGAVPCEIPLWVFHQSYGVSRRSSAPTDRSCGCSRRFRSPLLPSVDDAWKRGLNYEDGSVREGDDHRAGDCAAIAVIGISGAGAQGLGGAGTVQGTVKDPTGAPMVAVTVDLEQPGHRVEAQHHHGRGRQVRVPQPAAEPLPHQRHRAGVLQRRARRGRPQRRPDRGRGGAQARRHHGIGQRRRARGGSARARPDGAHRHRPEPDREAAAGVVSSA